ncbi:MAG: NifU family protein [Deltaproteobacteria bacterium]|nr:NifU family protein [Deltaproteobacteria bacterium]
MLDISLEFTPNPNTLKYMINRTLLERGAFNYTKADETESSPLAKRLFTVKGVVGVMIGRNFVTITKGEEGDWESLNTGVMAALKEHIVQGQPIVDATATSTGHKAGGESQIEDKIREILDNEVRPAVAMDGGDILYLQGACSGCPSSTATLRMGIENRLREAIPEVREVVSI